MCQKIVKTSFLQGLKNATDPSALSSRNNLRGITMFGVGNRNQKLETSQDENKIIQERGCHNSKSFLKQSNTYADSCFRKLHTSHQTKALPLLAACACFVPLGQEINVNVLGLVFCRAVVLGINSKEGDFLGNMILHFDGTKRVGKNIEKYLSQFGGIENVKIEFKCSVGGREDYRPVAFASMVKQIPEKRNT